MTIGLGDLAPDPYPEYYMVSWVLFTFFGLGFTTAMVQSLCDPNLHISASVRGLCPNWLTGALSHDELASGQHRSEKKRKAVARKESQIHLEKQVASGQTAARGNVPTPELQLRQNVTA